MRKLYFLLLTVLFASITKAQITVTIGAGSQTGTQSNGATGDCGPMYRSTATSNFVYSRHHYLYTAAEMAAAAIPAGTLITKLAWNKDNNAATTAPCIFQVWAKNSALTAVGPGGQLWSDLIAGSTQVYNNPAHVVLDPPAWQEITLTTPLLYTGGALEISVNFDISAGTSPWTTAGFSWKKDPITDRTLSYVGSTPPGTTLPNLRTVRAQIQITYVSAGACTTPPTPGAANATPSTPICTGTSVQLNLTGNSSGTGQTYIWQSASAVGGPYTDISASSPSSSFVVNPTTTTFYRAAVTCSGNTQNSTPVQVIVNPALPGGTYTVNPALPAGGGNYQTIAAAVNAMNCGIAGPVVFNVALSGSPYNEQIVIPAVGGASAVNTITFYGNGSVIQATPVTAARHILRLDGADFVTFRKFNLLAQAGSTFAWGVHLTNGADNNTIDSTTIDISAVTSTTQSNSAGIVGSGSTTSVTTAGNASNNTISNNTIIGGYQGIILIGTATSLNALNNTITKNEVRDWLVTGIEVTHGNGTVISYNNIHRTNRTDLGTTISQGIELGAGNINSIVNGNRIHDSHTAAVTQSGTFYGIYSNANDAPAGSENRIINNLIYKINSLTGTIYGLYNSSSDGVFYYHNTVVLDHAAATAGLTRGLYQLTLATGIQVRNNIIVIARGGTGVKYNLYFGTTTSTIISNNNVLLNTATAGTNGIGSFGTTGYVTLVDWQGANSNAYDQQSVSVDPAFTNPALGDYKPTAPAVNNIGAALGVTTDILELPRSLTTPDPGAYEFSLAAGADMGAQELVTPGIAANACYTNSETVTIRIRNSSSTTINFVTQPVTVTTNVTGAATQTLTAVVNTGTLASGATLDVVMTGTLNMSATGVYTFNAFTTVSGDTNPANDAMTPVTRTKAVLSAGTISSNPSTYCVTGGTPTLSTTGATGYSSLQWQQSTTAGSGFTDISGGTTNPFTVASAITQTMYYRLRATCSGSNVTSNEISVIITNPSVTGTVPATRCGSGTVTLSATGANNTSFNWYAAASGGVSLGSGPSFTTPVITNTTTYYVAANTGGSTNNVGLPAQIAGTSGAGTTNFGLVFDALSAFTLQTVTIYPISATAGLPGTVTIDVVDGTGAVIHTATVNVVGNPTATATAQTVSLNFNIAPGTNYKLRPGARSTGITGLLFEPSATAPPGGNYGYPFVIPGVVSINTSTLGAPPTNAPRPDLYYYFYNWSVSTGCESGRTPVIATVVPAPSATISYAGSPYCQNAGTATVTRTGTAGGFYSIQTGLSMNSVTGDINLGLSTPGTYTVTYTIAATPTCPVYTTTTSITITALPAATISYAGSPYCASTGTATITRTGTAGGTYSSTTGLSLNSTTGDVNLATSTPGTYTVTYTMAAGAGCPAVTTTASITVNTPSVAPTGATTSVTQSCVTTSVNLSVQGGSLGTGGVWRWYSGSCGGTLVGTGTTLNNISVSATTTFFVRAEGTCGNSACASVTVTINPTPTINLSAAPLTTLLPGQTTTLTATITPTTGTNTIQWFKNTVLVPGATGTTLTVGIDEVGSYTARVTTALGCTSLSAALNITITISPRLFISPNPNDGIFRVRYYSGASSFGFTRNLVLYNSNGQRVYNKPFTITGPYSSMDVNMPQLSAGIYVVMVTESNGTILVKGKVLIQ